MKRIAGILTGRRTAWVVLVACLVAIGLGLAIVPHPSDSAQVNPATSGDSQRVAEWQSAVPGSDLTNGIVVWSRSDGAALSTAEQASVRRTAVAVAALSPDPKTAWAQLSTDRRLVIAIVPLKTPAVLADAPAAADSLVAAARSGLAPGLRVRLTGDIETLAARADAGRSANGPLPVVWLVILAAIALILASRSLLLWVVPTGVVVLSALLASQVAREIGAAIGLAVTAEDAPLLLATGIGTGLAGSVLLVLRYRREWPGTANRFEAGQAAWLRAAGGIAIGSLILIIAALVFLCAASSRVRAFGLATAITIIVVTVAVLLAVPAALVVFGRLAFWLRMRPVGFIAADHRARGWEARRTIAVAVVGSVLLIGVAAGGTAALVVATTPPTGRAAIDARAAIDHSFTRGYGNQAIMIVPDSLAGETSVIAPTTLAMNLPGGYSVTVGPSSAGRTELITYFDIDPASAKAYETIRTLRRLIARTGGPTATTLVGGADAAAIDRSDASARDGVTVLPAAAVIALLLLLLADGRERRIRR